MLPQSPPRSCITQLRGKDINVQGGGERHRTKFQSVPSNAWIFSVFRIFESCLIVVLAASESIVAPTDTVNVSNDVSRCQPMSADVSDFAVFSG